MIWGRCGAGLTDGIEIRAIAAAGVAAETLFDQVLAGELGVAIIVHDVVNAQDGLLAARHGGLLRLADDGTARRKEQKCVLRIGQKGSAEK
jgi:hypothetical protein